MIVFFFIAGPLLILISLLPCVYHVYAKIKNRGQKSNENLLTATEIGPNLLENSLVASQGPVNNINQTHMASGLGAGVGISNDPTREQSKDVFSNYGHRSG